MRFIPVFDSPLALGLVDAFDKAVEFSLGYGVKNFDPDHLELALSLTSMPSPLLYFTWIREYLIRVRFITRDRSRLLILARPVLSPHHLFRIAFFLNHRIDPAYFRQEAQRFFEPYRETERRKG